MQRTNRQLAAVEPTRAAAFEAYDRLVAAGVPRQRLEIVAPADPAVAPKTTPNRKRALAKIVGGGIAGAAGGALAGLLICAALWLFEVGLFLANPLLAAFFIVAYLANAGGLVGALIGTRFGRSDLAARVQDAADAGRWTVVVHAQDPEERRHAESALAQAA
ncbi:MAG TPA: hypothetical protein RMH99_26820 [Sandaracinaceae bacterium LLY-WYZ-13_1]|nr:hypothetical protein [Sandaracinaceae bacterium LLY-WYZ-13_1]